MLEFRNVSASAYLAYEAYLNEMVTKGYHLKSFNLFYQRFEKNKDANIRYEIIPKAHRRYKGFLENNREFKAFVESFDRKFIAWFCPFAIFETSMSNISTMDISSDLDLEPLQRHIRQMKRSGGLQLGAVILFLLQIAIATDLNLLTSSLKVGSLFLFSYTSVASFKTLKDARNDLKCLQNRQFAKAVPGYRYEGITSILSIVLLVGLMFTGMYGFINQWGLVLGLWLLVGTHTLDAVYRIKYSTQQTTSKPAKYLAVSCISLILTLGILVGIQPGKNKDVHLHPNYYETESVYATFDESIFASKYTVREVRPQAMSPTSYDAATIIVMRLYAPMVRPLLNYEMMRYATTYDFEVIQVSSDVYVLHNNVMPNQEMMKLLALEGISMEESYD